VKNTIKSADDISSLFKKAQRMNTGGIMALVARSDKERGHNGRVAFIAGKRLGSAPRRNRVKRLMREAARAAGAPWEGFDVAFVARDSSVEATYGMMLRDMERIAGGLCGGTDGRAGARTGGERLQQQDGRPLARRERSEGRKDRERAANGL
jgi:ribonuclease P protein component